jgi:PD-(D/E)XK nuclease superfamily
MLDPFRPHGYGTQLLRIFLMTVVRAGSDAGIDVHDLTPLNIHLMELDDAEVRREWQAIDLVIVLPSAGIVIAAELKIDATQGTEQLLRYRKIVELTWPSQRWKQLLVFLTKRGESPNDAGWIPVQLSEVADAFEASSDAPGAHPRARDLLKAYLAMLRRHHMENEDLNELAQRLWSRHRETLDFLMEHRPDALGPLFDSLHTEAQQIAGRLSDLCKSKIEIDSETRAYIRLAVSDWDSLPSFRSGEGWTATGRLILFELSKSETEIKVSIILGPGPDEIRKRYFQAVQNSDIRAPGSLAKKYKWLKSSVLMKLTEIDSVELDDRKKTILISLENFFRETVPKLDTALAPLRS